MWLTTQRKNFAKAVIDHATADRSPDAWEAAMSGIANSLVTHPAASADDYVRAGKVYDALITRLRARGWDVLFSPELEVVHIGGVSTGGYRSRRMVLEHSTSIHKYFVKWRSPGWRAALRPLAWVVLRLRAEVVYRRGSQH